MALKCCWSCCELQSDKTLPVLFWPEPLYPRVQSARVQVRVHTPPPLHQSHLANHLHANGPLRDNLITRPRPATRSSARWEYRRGGMETSFCRGLILARASGKFLFKWSQAEKRQRICLAFCLTVLFFPPFFCFFLSACATQFISLYSTCGGSQEGPGNVKAAAGRSAVRR